MDDKNLAPEPVEVRDERMVVRLTPDCTCTVLFQGRVTQQCVERLLSHLALLRETLLT